MVLLVAYLSLRLRSHFADKATTQPVAAVIMMFTIKSFTLLYMLAKIPIVFCAKQLNLYNFVSSNSFCSTSTFDFLLPSDLLKT
ncbi:hypothetical protein BUY85_13430 [Staphylococcus equorum]|uniref:hypothetical protein n=1 Tax=Staphylococcus equorum TaxID=246432 RepID=UPI000D1C2FB1|nr:hypothetical protein [Staphylococcus equorum]PTE75226.1 hypothetical protein BUY85_13430 [Staphylococcus equorum]RIL38010.1 hypothetical protein BUY84_10460 [Staphylococcus equorum]